MRNNEKIFTIQKIINSKSKVVMRISFLPFLIIFCLFLTMINEDPIIVPSKGSVLSTEDDIPILEINVTTHETLTSQQMEKGEIMFFYHIEINKPSLYKLTLTMPPEVYEVRAEFWKITKNNYGDPRASHIESLYYYVGGITTTSSQDIVFSGDDFNKDIGLTLILQSNKYAYFDRPFSVKFTESHIVQTDQIHTTLTDEVRDINSYFILDQSKLDVEEAGFYYLSTTLTIAASTGIGSFNGWMNIRCISPEKEFNLYHNWYSTGFYGATDIIYLDPNLDYYFELEPYWWSDVEGHSIELTLQLSVDPVIHKLLSINESTSIEGGNELNIIKVAIPLKDSVKLTLSQNTGSNYDLKIISRLNTRNYDTFYSNWFENKLYEDGNSYEVNIRQISYIQLARREIDTSLAYIYNWPNDASHIWFGGLVETYEYEYSANDYFSHETRLDTWTDGGLMFDNEDYIYLRIESSDPMMLNSEIVSLNDDLPDNTAIDLTEEDPLKIYEFSGLGNKLYSFQYQSIMSVNEPSIFSGDENFNHNGLSTSIALDTSVLLPGIVNPIFSSNKDFQLVSILNGYSILVYAPSYSIYSNGRLTTPRDQIIDADEIRFSIAEILITTTVIKDTIPTVGNLIDITINATQETLWFSLVVEENEIYSVELEAHPFFRDDVEVIIVDTNGQNPFFGNNVITSVETSNRRTSSTMSGIKTVLIGKKNSQCYLSLKGYGLVRLHIEKLGSLNTNDTFNFPLNANAIFGIILILGITTFFTARLFIQKK